MESFLAVIDRRLGGELHRYFSGGIHVIDKGFSLLLETGLQAGDKGVVKTAFCPNA